MDIEQAIETVGRVGSDEAPDLAALTEARDTLAASLTQAREQFATNRDADALAAMRSLREAYDASALAVTEATAAAEALDAEADALLADLTPADADAEETPAAEEPVAEEQPQPVAAGARILPVRDAIARLGLTERPAAPAAPAPEAEPTRHFVTLRGREEMAASDVTALELGEAFSREARSGRVTDKHTVASFRTDWPDELRVSGDDMSRNSALVDSGLSAEAVAAAGGCCSLPDTLETPQSQASTARPIRDSLEVFGSTGSAQFFPPACLPTDGAGIWTCADDAAVDPGNEATWKDCSFLDCPERQEVELQAVYKCTCSGSHLQRFSPDQWANHLQALAAQTVRLAEAQLFAQMLDPTLNGQTFNPITTHTGEATGSVYVNLIAAVGRAIDTMVQDQRLTDVPFDVYAAGWMWGAVRNDLIARRLLESADVTGRQFVESALGNAGAARVIWSPDVNPILDDGAGGFTAQVDGPLVDYPAEAPVLVVPRGMYRFLDGGGRDLGLVTDHDLNRQNTVCTFMEQWESVVARGCTGKRIDVPVEVCQTAPGCEPVAS